MTGRLTKRAAEPQGGRLVEPPISRERASEIVAQEISDRAWQQIRAAFHDHGRQERALAASKLSRSKGDDKSWHMRKDGASKAIEAAMAKLEAVRSRHGFFLEEASEIYAIKSLGRSAAESENARRSLDEAYGAMLRAITIVERAEPMEIETPTTAYSRDLLVRKIRNALADDGIETRLSTGFDLGQLERKVRLTDLSAFEKLIAGFLIGDEKHPAAFSAWLRGALADGEKQG
jgi:hypothetical protein